MEEMFKQVINKISSYNIFNNLLPGVVFCYMLKYTTNIVIITDDWIENLFIFYFVGMILSRIGSIFIEPILKKIKIKNNLIKYTSYYDYKKASEIDGFLKTMLEVNNMYRTLISTFFCLFLCKCYFAITLLLDKNVLELLSNTGIWVSLIFLVALYICSFVKQTKYIYKSVELYKSKKIEEESDNKQKN